MVRIFYGTDLTQLRWIGMKKEAHHLQIALNRNSVITVIKEIRPRGPARSNRASALT
jgi:hypothetical protein